MLEKGNNISNGVNERLKALIVVVNFLLLYLFL
jgi:hypothetical protein